MGEQNPMAELKNIKKKLIKWICFCVIMAISFMLCIIGNAIVILMSIEPPKILLGALILFAAVFFISLCIGMKCELAYDVAVENYLYERIRNILDEHSIKPEKYKMIKRNPSKFDLAFCNQNVDYVALQQEIDNVLKAMNSELEMEILIRLL